MALTQLDYPVKEIQEGFNNVFPSQKELNINFSRLDTSIIGISSGTGGVVRIETADVLDLDLVEGDFVVWKTGSYSLRTSRITAVIDTTTVEVDEIFSSTDVTDSLFNYRKNWILEARFVDESTPTDEQTGVNLVIDDFSQVPNALDGSVSLDLSIVRDILTPSFNTVSGISENRSITFKVQFRESYNGQRDLPWVSPNVAPFNDTPIMVVLSSSEVPFNGFFQGVSQAKFVKGFPLLSTYVYSGINNLSTFEVTISISQYTLNKTLTSETTALVISNQSGVFDLVIPPEDIDDSTVFVVLNDFVLETNEQYDPFQYDPSQYQ